MLLKIPNILQRGLGHITKTLELVRENMKISIDTHDLEKFKADKKVAA